MINENFDKHPVGIKLTERRKRRRVRNVARGIVLALDNTVFRFDNADAFSFAVESRTAVSQYLYQTVLGLSAAELTELALKLKAEEKLLIDVLENALSRRRTITTALNRIPLEKIRQDHCWREIIASLCECEAAESYLQIAIVKYLQFLNSYQDVVRISYAMQPSHNSVTRDSAGGTIESASHETALFDVLQFRDADHKINPYRRLPQGEAVTLHTLPDHPITIMLSKYTFTLVNSNGWVLIDSQSKRHALDNDLNYVGRGRENDIALSSNYRNVSRKHVIIHPLDDQSIVLIDLSSHGTYVPPRQVDIDSRVPM